MALAIGASGRNASRKPSPERRRKVEKQQIVALAQRTPQVARAVDEIEREIGDTPMTPETLDEAIRMLEFSLDKPEAWPEIRRAAMADGVFDDQDLPRQFDPAVIVAILVVLYELQARAARPEKFARGGLAAAKRLAAMGRNGDTLLAHINPREAAMLARAGGSGAINPRTGLPEFSVWTKIRKVAVPLAVAFVAPYLAPSIGAALGASGASASMLGSAVIGGVSAKLTGGDPLKGALLGGLTSGLGGMVGSGVNEAMNLNLGSVGQAALGSGLIGAGMAAATGDNVLKGAAVGALGGAAAGYAGGFNGADSAAVNTGVQSGGQMFGNMLTAGYSPREAVAGGALTGVAAGVAQDQGWTKSSSNKPSDVVLDEMRDVPGSSVAKNEFSPGEQAINPETGDIYYPAGQAPTPAAQTPAAAASAKSGIGMNGSAALLGLAAMSALQSAPAPVQQAAQTLTPEQRAYLNRPLPTFDWGRVQQDAAASGMDLGRFMSQNWNRITSGTYYATPSAPRLARGGALGVAGRLLSGGGSGRDDTIDAKLSDGEYVMDAETVALLGDGSNKEGARRLDEMRQKIRQHKGKTLARGKFSPDARSPLAYLKGAM